MKSMLTEAFISMALRFKKLFRSHMSQHAPSTQGEYMTLVIIEEELNRLKEEYENQPGVTVSAINKRVKCTMPATSKMLNSLEEKGFIERIYAKNNRRSVYVNLTQKGKKELDLMNKHMDDLSNRVLERLGEEDANTLLFLLDKLYNIMKEEMETAGHHADSIKKQ